MALKLTQKKSPLHEPLINYNESRVSIPPNFVGEGYSSPQWKSPAWGGQFQNGGNIDYISNTIKKYPGLSRLINPKDYSVENASGKMKDVLNKNKYQLEYIPKGENQYIVNQDTINLSNNNKNRIFINPDILDNEQRQSGVDLDLISHGLSSSTEYNKFTKDLENKLLTRYSKEDIEGNGGISGYIRGYLSNDPQYQSYKDEMRFLPKDYFKPLDNLLGNKLQDGGIIQDDRGYWNPDNWGKAVKINSNNITMKNVKQNLLGISNTGDRKLMTPNNNYIFDGDFVTEYPIAKNGKIMSKLKNGGKLPKGLDDLINFTNYNIAQNGTDINKYLPYVNAGEDVLQGLTMLKGQKQAVAQANQMAQLTGVEGQAINSIQNDPIRRRYVRPEDIPFQTNQMFPSYGTGTDILSMQDGGEIQNMYSSPDTLYTDLEYTPIKNDNQIKNYQNGGDIYNILNSGKFGDFMNSQGENILGNINPYIGHVRGQMPTAGNSIGKGVGEAAGTFFGSPVGGAIGGFAGNLLGGLIDNSDNKIKKYENKSQNNINNILGGYFGQGIHDQNKAFMRTGGNIRQNNIFPTDKYAMGGELQTYNEGDSAEQISTNPHLPNNGETIMFKGPSHENGGMPVTYGNNPVEVEGGEPAMKLNNNLVVFGNLKIPNQFVNEIGDDNAKGKKFKNYINDLSKVEEKQNNLIDKSVDETNNLDVNTSFDKLKLTSLQANIAGANMKLKSIADKKQKVANIQSAINDTAQEYNLDAENLAQGKYKKAKNGIQITAQDGTDLSSIYNPNDVNKKVADALSSVSPQTNSLYPQGQDIGLSSFIPEGANISRQDYSYFNDLYQRAKQQGRGPLVQKFQQEFSQKYPDIAKNVLSKYPTTNYGKDHFNPDLVNTDLRGNYDSIFGKRTEQYHTDSNPYGAAISPIQNKINFPSTGFNYPTINSDIPAGTSQQSPTNNNKFPLASMLINSALPYLRNSNKMNLDPNQLTGELYALSQNQLEGVPAQSYSPQLSTPYDISYQDQLNANQSDFNSIQSQVGNNPEALSSLAGQKYNANSRILGEQFRANQGERDRVYEGNKNTLNDAQLKNLQIYDNQANKQAQAKSNTKAITQQALNSISSKISQNKLENRTLQTYENLYNYRFDNQGRAINENPLFTPNIPNVGNNNINGTISGPDGKPLYPQYKDGKFLGYSPLEKATIDEKLPASKVKKRNGDIVKAIRNL